MQCKILDLLGFAGFVVVAVNRLALRRGGFVGGRALPAIVLPMQDDSCQNAEDVSMKVHGPVENHRRFYCNQQKGHDCVADGQLRGGPGDNVIPQFQYSPSQKIMSN